MVRAKIFVQKKNKTKREGKRERNVILKGREATYPSIIDIYQNRNLSRQKSKWRKP